MIKGCWMRRVSGFAKMDLRRTSISSWINRIKGLQLAFGVNLSGNMFRR